MSWDLNTEEAALWDSREEHVKEEGELGTGGRVGGGTGSLAGAGEGSEVRLGFVGHYESGFYTGDFLGSTADLCFQRHHGEACWHVARMEEGGPWEDEGGCGEGVSFRMCLEVWDLGRKERESLEWPQASALWRTGMRPRLPGAHGTPTRRAGRPLRPSADVLLYQACLGRATFQDPLPLSSLGPHHTPPPTRHSSGLVGKTPASAHPLPHPDQSSPHLIN